MQAGLRRSRQLAGRLLARLVRGLEDAQLDGVAHGSPAASSRERTIAAWIALRNAARTPACSSSWRARIVVPPGEVTISRSSTGCIFSSRSSFAVPNIVCTTRSVEISRESPSRMPGLDHRLGEEREVGRARAGDGGDGVHVGLRDADDAAHVA